jgi:ABC-type phosphate transport system substrate-binding protein
MAYAMLVLLLSVLTASSSSAGEMVRLKGSGASFPFPIYGLWFKEYGKAHRHVIIDYQAKGSGAGVRDFLNKTVDFAASDAGMTDAQMQEVDGGVQLLPMTAGAIVLSYNLPGGPKELKLSRQAYTSIFLGQVTQWDDPVIVQANQLSVSLFSPANTLAALLALNFPEADKIQVQALMYAAAVLLAITLMVNICGEAVLRRATAGLSGVRK